MHPHCLHTRTVAREVRSAERGGKAELCLHQGQKLLSAKRRPFKNVEGAQSGGDVGNGGDGCSLYPSPAYGFQICRK